MTIVPSVRPTHLLPPRWSPLVDRTLNVTVEPGGMGAPRCRRRATDAFWERSWRYSWVCAGVQVFIASLIAWGTGVPNTMLINRFLQQIHS